MNILESLRTAVASVFSNKMRTFLTSIGIIIGVSSVIAITSVGNSFQATLSKEFEQINSSVVQIVSIGSESEAAFDIDDIKTALSHQNVKNATGLLFSSAAVTTKDPNKNEVYSIFAVNSDYYSLQSYEFCYGGVFSEKDDELKARVAIIDENIALDIFGRKDVIGQEMDVIIKGYSYKFRVVGVTAVNGNIYEIGTISIPLNTALDLYGQERFFSLGIGLEDQTTLDKTKNQVIRMIATNHNVDDNNYYALSNLETMDTVKSLLSMFTLLIGVIAAISLLVGGIGVMNIMVVTVTERTREIGIRKSLGATNGNIKFQFLLEAIVLCSLGGIIGIAFGYLEANIVCNILSKFITTTVGNRLEGAVISPVVAIAAMLVSVGIGVIFGVYPAGKAAKLDPIEALRYE